MPNKSTKSTKTSETPQKVTSIDERNYQTLSIDLIDDPEAPMRKDLTPANVEQLVLSIKQVGLIEPIVVKPKNGRYEVIAGHRRLFAHKIGKIPTIPAYIRTANTEETEMLKIHENLHREEVSPADEASHYNFLIQKQKLTPVKISQMIGKSLSYVTDRLAILNYPDFLRTALDDKSITFSVAREFAKFEDIGQMREAVYYAKRNGMTQETARKWVFDWRRDQQRILNPEEPTAYANGEEQQIEHLANCIYCQQPDKLINFDVVYIHSHCRQAASQPEPPTESAT